MKFYNEDKSVTAYSLACGYIESIQIKGIYAEFYKEAGCSVYQVRVFDRNGCGSTRLQWSSFDTLTKGRKEFYKALKKHLGIGKAYYLRTVAHRCENLSRLI